MVGQRDLTLLLPHSMAATEFYSQDFVSWRADGSELVESSWCGFSLLGPGHVCGVLCTHKKETDMKGVECGKEKAAGNQCRVCESVV